MRTIKRRRREYKTDYLKRLKLLKSDSPRIVFRKTNKYLLAQYIISNQAQDKVEFGISSKALLKYGWPEKANASLTSLTASYLLGLLIGKKIIEKKLKSPIIDFGMIRTMHKTKPHAFLKGIVDGGVKIKCKEETFPDDSRIKGEHLKNKISFDTIKLNIQKK